ncbi:hypothetical protein GCM10010266_40700 [Streptomyces griseomycini]|nr:hypothetical protein GCM10010266_40700 [Streptomyces griseomycini]
MNTPVSAGRPPVRHRHEREQCDPGTRLPVPPATGPSPVTATVSRALGPIPGSPGGASATEGNSAAGPGASAPSAPGPLLDEPLQRPNAVENVLAAVVNTVAAAFFLFVADFDRTAVALIAAGSAPGWERAVGPVRGAVRAGSRRRNRRPRAGPRRSSRRPGRS